MESDESDEFDEEDSDELESESGLSGMFGMVLGGFWCSLQFPIDMALPDDDFHVMVMEGQLIKK